MGRWGKFVAYATIATIVLLAVAIVVFWETVRSLEGYGYVGAFLISILGGATVIVPVPSLPVVFALGGVMKYPALVGVAAGLGEPLGEITGYMAGWGGRAALIKRNEAIYSRLEGWMRRRGGVALAALAALPNPFFDLAGAAAGALRFPLWKFLLYCWMGKTVKGLWIAFAGYWGLGAILKWLGAFA